ncbi:transcriptional regulator [Thermococcus litoralis DSM 5473]|uniref:Transcriptional regulator n=1 Tax=Thermococcus litoralis (strain ATCC 51850 / DSM 5473 / JCM 8560 / NS-C) TaxID=523849 RepID=H3ZMJ9_THELN|nr:Lrp/AsnC family transcriptional regulator [Thermococcus litoralis]EHR78793.1 transcriptional regulator [Thermococcus litoralis DSM 5473]
MYEDESVVLRRILKDKLDGLDIKIYQLLRENGRMSDTKIAEKLGVSVTTIRRRRMRLQEEGILQIIALILLRAADVAYADVLVKFKKHAKMENIREFLSKAVMNPRIYEVTEYIGGECDVLLRFFEANPETLKYHIDKFLREEDIVEKYTIYLAIGSPKAWYRQFKLRF